VGTSRPTPDALSGFPYRELALDRDGQLVEPDQVAAVAALAEVPEPVTDLVVLVHGWNNDEAEAFGLYRRLAASFSDVRAGDTGFASRPTGRRIGLVGVFWPSKKFADADLIPGGAAGLDDDLALRLRLDELAGTFDVPDAKQRLAGAARLAGSLADSTAQLAAFVDLVRGLVPDPDARPASEDVDAADLFGDLDAAEVAERLRDPTLGDPGPGDLALWTAGPPSDLGGVAWVDGGAGLPTTAGGAAGFVDLPPDVRTAARRWLNYTTYFQMKKRSGLVAQQGLAPALATAVGPGQRLHLVGHSFGARLVTATVAAGCPTLSSLSLLQGAFSHFAFAKDWQPGSDGQFRQVLTSGRIAGPVIVTHTRNDRAVGLAYAVASRLARQNASTLGDASSRYGGLGSNGALSTPEAVRGDLLPARAGYALLPGRVHNLLADRFVSDHGDVTGPEVANAVLTAAGVFRHE